VHFWSLAIEEQFYLLWPLLVVMLSVRNLERVCGSIVVGEILLRLFVGFFVPDSANWLYHATPAQLDGLAMGSLVAALASRAELRVGLKLIAAGVTLGLGAIGALAVASHGMAVFADGTPFSVMGPVTFGALFAVALVFVIEFPDHPIVRPLKSKFLRATGRISYGLYVIHYPVSWLLSQPPALRLLRLSAPIVYVALTTGIALASWRFLERPLLALRDRSLTKDFVGVAVTSSPE
jgi:peptidoglycan/LPS O-acetylase OafA/YrhL